MYALRYSGKVFTGGDNSYLHYGILVSSARAC